MDGRGMSRVALHRRYSGFDPQGLELYVSIDLEGESLSGEVLEVNLENGVGLLGRRASLLEQLDQILLNAHFFVLEGLTQLLKFLFLLGGHVVHVVGFHFGVLGDAGGLFLAVLVLLFLHLVSHEIIELSTLLGHHRRKVPALLLLARTALRWLLFWLWYDL